MQTKGKAVTVIRDVPGEKAVRVRWKDQRGMVRESTFRIKWPQGQA